MIEPRTYGPLRRSLAVCLADSQPRVVRDLAQHVADLMNQLEATMAVRDKLRAAEDERQERSKRQLAALSSLTEGLTRDELADNRVTLGHEPLRELPAEVLQELSPNDEFDGGPIHAQYLADVATGLTDPDAVSKPPFAADVELPSEDDEEPTQVFESSRPVTATARPDSHTLLAQLLVRDREILDDLAQREHLEDTDNEELEL